MRTAAKFRSRPVSDWAGFSEAESGTCHLQIRCVLSRICGAADGHSGQILEKVVEYLQWHARNAERSEFNIKEFERKIPPELALELCVTPAFAAH